ncbi:MAG: hypothetical protein KGZ97_07315 [Bacteroidetes bacterium]|nr:hypothetical protein [Bacteroidota bacterium]
MVKSMVFKSYLQKGLLLLVIWLLMPFGTLYSQNADLQLSKDSILIGEQTELLIKITCSDNANTIIPWQGIYDSISNKFEIVGRGNIDTIFIKENSQKEISQKLSITAWKEGMHVIFPFEFGCEIDSEITRFESPALLLSVYLIDVDEELPIKDIKPILSIPYTLREVLPWVLLIVAITIIAWLLYKYRHRLKKQPKELVEKPKPDVPAHEFALAELENLRKKKLWQDGKVKLYHVELSGIVRYYIELRYDIIAMEMTTDETLSSIKQYMSDFPEQYKSLEKILTLADLVKFAKYQPLPDENHKNLDLAFEFVNITKEEIID